MRTATKSLILRYTAKDDLTALELADMLGIAKRNVTANLKQLIDLEAVKIVGYQPNYPGSPSPKYSSANGRRCVPYQTTSNAEQARRYRENNAWRIRARQGKQIMGVTV